MGMKDFYISPSKISIAYQSASKAKINLVSNIIWSFFKPKEKAICLAWNCLNPNAGSIVILKIL